MAIPTGKLRHDAEGRLRALNLPVTDELLAVWFDGWCSGYTDCRGHSDGWDRLHETADAIVEAGRFDERNAVL